MFEFNVIVPASASRSVDFPEPEGPMMARAFPGSAYPVSPSRIAFSCPDLLWSPTLTHKSFHVINNDDDARSKSWSGGLTVVCFEVAAVVVKGKEGSCSSLALSLGLLGMSMLVWSGDGVGVHRRTLELGLLLLLQSGSINRRSKRGISMLLDLLMSWNGAALYL